MLITTVSKILVEENIFSVSEFITLNRTELIKILLFGHPERSEKPSLCLFKQTCVFLSKHPLF